MQSKVQEQGAFSTLVPKTPCTLPTISLDRPVLLVPCNGYNSGGGGGENKKRKKKALGTNKQTKQAPSCTPNSAPTLGEDVRQQASALIKSSQQCRSLPARLHRAKKAPNQRRCQRFAQKVYFPALRLKGGGSGGGEDGGNALYIYLLHVGVFP